MKKPIVLIDTNILLSGLIWNGNEARLLEMAVSGDIQILVPEIVLREAKRVLEDKFPDNLELLDQAAVLLKWQILPPPAAEIVEKALQSLRDAADAEILASIVESQPDYAVTGDKDLLTPEAQSLFPTSRCRDVLAIIARQ